MSSPLESIQRACAVARLQGINIYEVFADPRAFRELEQLPQVEKRPCADGDTTLVVMTCSGPCRVKKDMAP